MENQILFLQSLLAIITIILSFFNYGACEIKKTNIVDDSRPIILFERFGFALNGDVTVSVEHVLYRSKHHDAKLNPSSMGFFLVSDASFPRILNESSYTEAFCVLSSQYVKPVFKFDELSPVSSHNATLVISEEPDEYNLIFGNCQPEFHVSMRVFTEMYNVNGNGEKDFLPAGQTQLPMIFFFFFSVYLCFLAVWVSVCVKQSETVKKIHIIMLALLVFKALRMICAAEDKMFIRKTGTPHGWDVAFYIFGFLKGITLFTVIILIGTGWSFLKPYLQEREKKLLMFAIPLQVVENIAAVVIAETGPAKKEWLVWNETFLLIDVVCCCTIFFPIFWSIRSLREASGKAARNLEKLTLFKQFYVVVVAYLYFTRLGVAMIGNAVSYMHEWVVVAAAETVNLVFYLFIFYNFRPIEKNPYLAVDHYGESSPTHHSKANDEHDFIQDL
ncbi:PREDICTED: protein GPR107-like [Ipomoea nil]|uniref:protein GPR107-like n=1 Tax=Ipomoea nil TaxID=35883 RepID=UPI000900ECA2|nr:PREDICTED: protein GPR107-like [Ipomoea nil]